MKTIRVHDKNFSLFLSSEKIQEIVKDLANKINRDLQGQNPLMLVILNGAFMFAADLFKYISIPCEISFVKMSSYIGTQSTSVVRELIGLDEKLTGRSVVIVEDIIDTGITMGATTEKLKKSGTRDVRIATLLFKPEAFRMNYSIDYIGLEIPNVFIVGYGLDYNRQGRNFPDIYKIVEE